MLGKLIKHEFNATKRLLIPLYLVLICISVINLFLFKLGYENSVFKIFTGFLLAFQVILIIAILITTALFMIIRFYKNLLSDEGYLMFTLPVKAHQLITSKLLVTAFWLFLSIIAILASLCIVFAAPYNINLIIYSIQKAYTEFSAAFGESWMLLIVEFLLLIPISMVATILLIYVSIAVGQLFSKHKIIGSFVAYVILYNAIQLLMMIVMAIFGLGFSGDMNSVNVLPQVFFPVLIIIGLIECTGFYAATNYIFKRKLNLD